MFCEHIYYFRNDIQKPFKMGTIEYTEHVCEMFKMDKLLPPPLSNNEDYHEDSWDNKDKPYKEEIICKATKEVLLASIKEEVNKKFDRNYRTIPTKDYIGLLGTLEAMDERRRADRGYQKTISKKKTYDKPDGDDATVMLYLDFLHKKQKNNIGKGKQQNNAIHGRKQCYCVLCNKEVPPKSSYTSHYSEKCNEFEYSNTNKDFNGSISK